MDIIYTRMAKTLSNILKLSQANCKVKINNINCVALSVRRYATTNSSPRNMFELYEKNSHWLGVYKRHPVINEILSKEQLREKAVEENQKKIPLDLSMFINPRSATWTSESKRVCAIGMKLGTTNLWTQEGYNHQITLVQIKECHVLDTQVSHKDGGNDRFTQMIIGAHDITDEKYIANMSRSKMEWYDRLGTFPKRFWTGFQVTKDALLLPGTEITARHFQPGQYVSVRGVTIKRGMQGVMRRWGMKGQPASHGQTKTHRKMGATGGGQDPGRIFPGKKMAGHVGGVNRVTPPLKLFRINTKYNILFIKGSIPGQVGSFITIKDGRNRLFPNEAPPFPTHFTDSDDIVDDDLYADYVCQPTSPSLEFPPYKV